MQQLKNQISKSLAQKSKHKPKQSKTKKISGIMKNNSVTWGKKSKATVVLKISDNFLK